MWQSSGSTGIQRQLRRCKGPWIHVLAETRPDNDRDWTWPLMFMHETSLEFRVLRGHSMRTVDQALSELGAVWQVPTFGYYIRDVWDGMENLSWLASLEGLGDRRPFADAYVQFIADADVLLDKEYERTSVRSFFKFLHDLGQQWAAAADYGVFHRPPTPFHTILHVLPNDRDMIWSKLEDARSRLPEIDFDEISTAGNG
jgi:hypothetical protein